MSERFFAATTTPASYAVSYVPKSACGSPGTRVSRAWYLLDPSLCGTSVTPRYPTVPRPRMGSTNVRHDRRAHAGSRHRGPAKRYLRPAKRYLRTAKPYLRCRHCRRQSARGLQKKELAPPSLHTLTSMETFVSGSNTHRIGMQRLGPLANATSEGDPVMQIKCGVGKINNACRVGVGRADGSLRGARRPRSASCALRPPACWGSLMLPNWQPAAGQRLASRFGAGCPPPGGK